MIEGVEAVFFDMGSTLRTRTADEGMQREALAQLVALLGVEGSPETFYQHLLERVTAYKKWSVETLIEAPEKEIWTRWMLPDRPSDEIEPLAEQLTHLWRSAEGRRMLRPDARLTVTELARRGYCLGLISNTISAHATPNDLQEYGLSSYFQTIILSSTFGRRKPDPAIFIEATRQVGVSPAKSAYVGDQISRDVVGPRQAGFAAAILIENRGSPQKDYDESLPEPDAVIHELSELLDMFPPRQR